MVMIYVSTDANEATTLLKEDGYFKKSRVSFYDLTMSESELLLPSTQFNALSFSEINSKELSEVISILSGKHRQYLAIEHKEKWVVFEPEVSEIAQKMRYYALHPGSPIEHAVYWHSRANKRDQPHIIPNYYLN